MKSFKLCFLVLPSILLVACGQPQVVPVSATPIYNKMGDVVGCEGGDRVPNTSQENPCDPPDDCVIVAGTNECYPTGKGDDPDPDPQNPTGGIG